MSRAMAATVIMSRIRTASAQGMNVALRTFSPSEPFAGGTTAPSRNRRSASLPGTRSRSPGLISAAKNEMPPRLPSGPVVVLDERVVAVRRIAGEGEDPGVRVPHLLPELLFRAFEERLPLVEEPARGVHDVSVRTKDGMDFEGPELRDDPDVHHPVDERERNRHRPAGLAPAPAVVRRYALFVRQRADRETAQEVDRLSRAFLEEVQDEIRNRRPALLRGDRHETLHPLRAFGRREGVRILLSIHETPPS